MLDSDRPKRIKKWLDMCSVSSDLMVNLLNFSQDVTNSSNKLNKKQTCGKVNKTKAQSVIRASNFKCNTATNIHFSQDITNSSNKVVANWSFFHGPGMVCVLQPELIEGKKSKYTFYSKCISNSQVLLQLRY